MHKNWYVLIYHKIKNIHNLNSAGHPLEEHFRPQCSFITWPKTESEFIYIPQFIGRFETLTEDFNSICQTIGIKAPLEFLNTTRQGQSQDYYTPELTEIVKEIYTPDINLYNKIKNGKE